MHLKIIRVFELFIYTYNILNLDVHNEINLIGLALVAKGIIIKNDDSSPIKNSYFFRVFKKRT